MATIMLGSARIDENGKANSGKAGDQKQTSSTNDTIGEVSMQKFYKHSKGWNIFRAKNPEYAKKLAEAMTILCNNANVGYDQYNRLGVIKYGIETKVATEADCSSSVRACIIYATGKDVGNFTTYNEKTVLINSGLFDFVGEYSSQTKTPVYDGDILCTKTKGHTVIVVSGNPRTDTVVSTPVETINNNETCPYAVPTILVTSTTVAKQLKYASSKYQAKGNAVKWVQWYLRRAGEQYRQLIDNAGGVDGVCGNATAEAIGLFQKNNGLTADKVVGKYTRQKLITVYGK